MLKSARFAVLALTTLVTGCATGSAPVLQGWDAKIVPAEPSGWQTRVIPETLWRPGWQWC